MFRSTTLRLFLEKFKDHPEDALPHLQMLLSNTARTLATAWDIQYIRRDTTILEAAQTLLHNEVVVISGRIDQQHGAQEPDVLWRYVRRRGRFSMKHGHKGKTTLNIVCLCPVCVRA